MVVPGMREVFIVVILVTRLTYEFPAHVPLPSANILP